MQRLRDALVARNCELAVTVKPLCDGLAEAHMVTCHLDFDLDDPDWPASQRQVEDAGRLLDVVKARVAPPQKG